MIQTPGSESNIDFFDVLPTLLYTMLSITITVIIKTKMIKNQRYAIQRYVHLRRLLAHRTTVYIFIHLHVYTH